MNYRHEIVERRICYQGYFRVYGYRLRHERFEGGFTPILERELVHRGEAAAVIPYDPDTDRVVMVEQFRVAPLPWGERPWMTEFVAGMIEPGEAPADVARRESREEAGLEIRDLVPVMRLYLNSGGSAERLQLYCARVDSTRAGGIHGLAAEGENIRVVVRDRQAALESIGGDEPQAAWVAAGLMWLTLHRERLMTLWGL